MKHRRTNQVTKHAAAARVQRFVRLRVALTIDQNMELADVRRQVEMLDNGHVNTVASKKMSGTQLLIMSPAGLRQTSIEIIVHFARRHKRPKVEAVAIVFLCDGIPGKWKSVFLSFKLDGPGQRWRCHCLPVKTECTGGTAFIRVNSCHSDGRGKSNEL